MNWLIFFPGIKNERMSNLEYLGVDMIEAGNEFGTTTPYGAALIRVGQTEKKLGLLEKEYIRGGNEGMVSPLTRFLDGEMKNIMRERKVGNGEIFVSSFISYLFFVDSWKQKTRSGRLQEPCAEGEEYAGPDPGDIVWGYLHTSANTDAILERWAGPPGCAGAGGERAEAQPSGVRQTGAALHCVSSTSDYLHTYDPKYYLIIMIIIL